MRDLLERIGVLTIVLELLMRTMLRRCRRSMQFAHAKHRPKVKTWFGRFFNHVVQADLFYLWDCAFSCYGIMLL